MPLYAAGSNSEGQLGIGSTDDASTFQPCLAMLHNTVQPFPPAGAHIKTLASTGTATLVHLAHAREPLWIAGTAPSTGNAAYSVFHAMDMQAIYTAAQIHSDSAVHTIAASWDCFFLVLRTRTNDVCISLGVTNTFGQLGTGNERPSSSIHRVHFSPTAPLWPSTAHSHGTFRIASISAGVRHMLAVVTYTSADVCITAVYGWGEARHGQLGSPRPPARKDAGGVPRRIRSTPMLLGMWPYNGTVQAACGMQHSVLVFSGATTALWMMGAGRFGQTNAAACIPHGARASTPAAPAAPVPAHVAAHTVDRRCVQAACNWSTTLLLWEGGAVTGCGSNAHGQLSGAGQWHEPAALAAGSEHSVLREGSTLYGWGWNEHGNLTGAAESVARPAQLSARCTQAWAGCATTWIEMD